MAVEIEFGSKATADDVREEYADALAETDDRRLRTVRFREGQLAEHELDRIIAAAERGQFERGSTSGQVELTEAEKERVGPFTGSNNYRKAAAVKAIMLDAGVDDWTAFYDSTLTVDEHRGLAEQAVQDVQGERLDANEGDQPRGDLERAVGEQCDHARGHCRYGDPEACEFLGEACGFTEAEIEAVIREGEDPGETPFTGPQLGALRRAWGGYQGAVARLETLVGRDVREATQHAGEAIEAINAIRATAGQEPLEPRRLQEVLSVDLEEAPDPDRTPTEVIEMDEQRDLSGGLSNPQARLTGGQTGEVETETEVVVEENPGGLMADKRADDDRGRETKQMIPDEFRVAEGGQKTL